MYRDTYQRGMLTIFYSVGAKPLSMWDTGCSSDGEIKPESPDLGVKKIRR